jgi:hypothetical protein
MEVIIIKIPIQSTKKDVKIFLNELMTILNSQNFNEDNDLIIIKSTKDDIQFSTGYLMLDLDYDTSDIVERLKELTLAEYSETLIDKDDSNPPLLFVFGKSIDNKLVYIKLKIKGNTSKKILCLSFHYARHNMKFPYK